MTPLTACHFPLQVVVFSWTFCPFAKRAKGLLTELGARFHAVELDQLADGRALKAELGMVTPHPSSPPSNVHRLVAVRVASDLLHASASSPKRLPETQIGMMGVKAC